jgi:hypothetical protein
MLQHKSKDSCLFGLWLDAIQSVLMMCKIKRVMDGLEQGLDIIVTLILFQDRLPYRRRYHERLVRKMIHMDLPWGLLKVNRAPSLRMGKAVRKLAQPRTSKGHYAHFCNWAQRIHHPLILPTALSHVFDRTIGTIRFMDSSARSRAKRGFLVLIGGISSRLCGIALPVSTG